MNHEELRKESEPDYQKLCDEISLKMPRVQPMDSEFPIDFALIQKVLRNEKKRELEKQWNGQAGLRAKRLSSSSTGKNRNRARVVDCITDISK